MSKLATFRIDEEAWQAFLDATKQDGASASSILVDFVNWYVAGNRISQPEQPRSSDIENLIESRIASLEAKLENRIARVEELLGEVAA
jgi:negative regulator of replication initiation